MGSGATIPLNPRLSRLLLAICWLAIVARQERKRQREETMGSDPERTFSGPEREYIKETYDVMLGTFKDYAEMIIQARCGPSSCTGGAILSGRGQCERIW